MTESPIDLAEDRVVPTVALLCMQQMSRDANRTMNRLIESYRADAEELQAALDIIRADIFRAISGNFMPTPKMIESLLWPAKERITAVVEGRKEVS